MNFRSFILFLLVFVLPFLSHGQDHTSLGPRIGVNLANVSNVDNSESRTGLVLGLTLTYSISETSGIGLDILYSQEGYELNQKLKANYLAVPIHFMVFLGQLGESFRPKFYAGPALGLLLSAESGNNDIKDNMNDFVFGISAGLGFNYRLASRIWLNADVRALLGLSDIRDQDFQQGDTVAARNIQISLGVAYGLSRL